MVNVDVHVTKRRPLKGAVLFTVLVVMIVMLILMITTIGLASNASRRAYSEYFDHQTNSTARSVVESAIEHLRTNTDLGEAIVGDVDSIHDRIDVTVNGGADLGDGFGHVDHLYFENVGTDSASSFNITGSGKPIIKVTAVVTQGGVTSTYSQYCIGDIESTDESSNGGGLVALGGFEGYAQPGVDAHSPAYFGVKNAFSWNELVTLSNPNDNSVMNSMVVNSSARSKTQVRTVLGRKEGLSVMGNFFCTDGTIQVYNDKFTQADYKNSINGGTKSTDNAYLYVGGTVHLTQKLIAGHGNDHQTADYDQAPINLYCGRIVMDNSAAILGNLDIYCYNEGSTTDRGFTPGTSTAELEAFAHNPWSRFGTYSVSKLLSWAESLSDSHRNSNLDSGSLYTMGNLQLQNKVQIAGDLFVKGNLDLVDIVKGGADGSQIKGNVYVAGSITGNIDDLIAITTGNIYNGTPAEGSNEKLKAYDAAALPGKVNSFLSGDLTHTNVRNNVVNTTDKVYNEFYENKKNEHGEEITPVVKTVKGAVNKSNLNISGSTVVYTYTESEGSPKVKGRNLDGHDVPVTTGTIEGKDYAVEINQSCILKGEFKRSIYINAELSDIWIDCFNFSMDGNAEIIINDKKKVNFYLPADNDETDEGGISDQDVPDDYIDEYKALFSDYTDENGYNDPNTNAWVVEHNTYKNSFRTGSATKIQTVSYLKNFKPGAAITIPRYPTADTDTTNDWMLPNVGIYGSESGLVLVKFQNNIFFTGDIFLPGGDIRICTGCNPDSGMKVTYEGTYVDSERVGLVGSIIVNKIKQFDNRFTMLYVDTPPGGGEHDTGDDVYVWNPLDGFADY